MIKTATVGDSEILSSISCNCIKKSFDGLYENGLVNLYLEKYSQEYFQKILLKADFFLIYIEGIPVGIIGLLKNVIIDFFILEKYQNQGYGTKLLNYIILHAKSKGFDILELESSIPGRKFYESKGFKFIKEIDKLKGTYKYRNAIYQLNIK